MCQKENDVKCPIKENIVNVVVLKIDNGYRIAWYVGSTFKNYITVFMLKCECTIKQFASFATIWIRWKILVNLKNEGEGTQS